MKDNANIALTDYDVFFFDFDGVVLQSVQVKTEAFQKMYEPFGEEVVQKVTLHHERHGGVSRFEKFRHYHKEFLGIELAEAEVQELAEQFSELVFEATLQCPFVPGVRRLLEWALENQKQCFLVTGIPELEAKEIVKKLKLEEFFVAIKGSPKRKEVNLEVTRSGLWSRCFESSFFW